MLTQVVAKCWVAPESVAGIAYAASSLRRVGMNHRKVREFPEWVHGIERQVVPRKRCSFR